MRESHINIIELGTHEYPWVSGGESQGDFVSLTGILIPLAGALAMSAILATGTGYGFCKSFCSLTLIMIGIPFVLYGMGSLVDYVTGN
jgi:hypothetical protein